MARRRSLSALGIGVVLVGSLVTTPRVLAESRQRCGTHPAVGGYEDSSLRLGNKADVFVNDLSQNDDHDTWRSVTIWKNNRWSAEVGWYSETTLDSLAHPYKTYVRDGIANTVEYSNVSINPLAADHTFKVHDQNHDHEWSYAWDGNALGNITINFDWGYPLDESEACTTSDDSSAHFSSLQRIACTNCAWSNYSTLKKWVETGSYHFCKISATEFRVKQTC